MEYRTNGLLFKWEGGPYIDVYVDGEESPRECINVWDYSKGQSTILYGDSVAFIGECEEWLEGE